MNLLDLMVKITCDDQASGQVEGIGSRITGTIGKVGSVVSAVLGSAAVAGAVAITKGALDAYASYEQLVGGMDTLFKGASGTIQQYADNAYRTAGVSANRYMQITTSFAASLISSLGGDTAAAAEMADMAITDMSDNANKMGTSLETVQEAYMSLSRGNYEMLDSLALGYAGTKKGLEQLLADAERYSAAQGEARDFSVDSYADIVEAIHIVQTEMGITGTTAEEAASTIEGSVNQMKAAWENWLTGLGNERADMSVLTDQLVDSIGTVLDNVIPRLGIIIGTLVQEIGDRGPEVAAALQDMLLGALSTAFDIVNSFVQGTFGFSLPEPDMSAFTSAIESVQGVVRDIVDGLAPGLESMVETVVVVGEAMAEAFSPAVQAAVDLLSTAAEQLGQFMEHMGTQIQEVLVPALQPLGDAFTGLFEAIEPLIEPARQVAEIFGNVLVGAVTALMNALTFIINVITAVINAITNFGAFLSGVPSAIGGVVSAVIQWFSQLPGNIASFLSTVISNVASWVSTMVSNAVQAGSQFLSNVVNFLSQLPGRVWSFLTSVISNVASWVGNMASNAVRAGSQFLSNVVSGISQLPGRVASFLWNVISNVGGFVSDMASNAIDAASRFASNLIDGLGSIPGRVADIGGQIIQGMVDGVVGAAGDLIDAVGGAINDAIGWAKGLLGIASPSKLFRTFGRYTMQGMSLGIDDDADLPVRSMDSAMRGVASAVRDVPSPTITVSGSSYSDLLSAVESLHSDLAAIIRDNTPVMTRREFRRAVASV